MFTLPHLRNPYKSSVTPIVQPWINPDRNSLMTFRFRWHLIRQFVVFAIIFVALYSPRNGGIPIPLMLVLLLLYVIWQLGSEYLISSHWMATPKQQQRLGIIQFVVSMTGLTALLWTLYSTMASDAWLLYFIPLLTIGRSLERRWAFAFILIDVGLLSLSAFIPFFHHSMFSSLEGLLDMQMEFPAAVRDFVIRGLAGGYIGFSSYLLVRSLAYQNRISRYTTERMNEVTKKRSWSTATNTIAEIMAEVLSNPRQDVVANVIAFDRKNDSLAVIGSSTKQGQTLANKDYRYSATRGITGWAARNQCPCYMNDTERDPERRFLTNAAFPATRSALAVPVPIDDRQIVILEVESPHTFNFADEDVQLLEIVGGHLLASHERTKILEVHRRLADMGQELAQSIIRVEQIPDMLKHIGSVFLDLLDAQVISFHYRHSAAEIITDRAFVGELHCEPTPSMPFVELDSLTTSLMDHQTPMFFQDASQEEMLVKKRFHHIRLDVEPFVVRESIISCAAIPLVVAQESMGVMWINYRRMETFDQTVQDLIQLLAPYASLAIQAGSQSMLEEQKRREGLRRILHDSLSHRLHDVMRSLERLGQSSLTTKKVKEEWRIVRAQVARARQAVNNLIAGQTWLTFQSLVQDLQTHAQIIQETYEIPVVFSACELPSMALSLTGGNELIYACDEAIGNALRHSQLTELTIDIDFDDHSVDVKIRDNGVGFTRDRVVQGLGLRSIEDRIDSLGGAATITSAPGQGTCVRFRVPVPLSV